MKQTKEEIKQDIKDLKRLIGRKYEVRTKVNHVSQSGMTRHISCYVVHKGEIHCIDYLVSRVIEWRQHDNGGIVVGGCGMDMGFHLVYTLSRIMYPKGFKSSTRNMLNGMNPKAKDYGWDKDGGYRLTQRWM